ncbi:carboxypeptidase-like regulatory domain-containing protein [Hymenobacter sp. RP-2-7]|uniref:Carboxypeptidase-like regulatory domain-containing protein n=1 Tax=Hymenobacter polaris TaxID=2682546 RepID=A0A7Y0AIG1_9BACT|nr:carboxypeptidase-like regulatory domain-containing protein [Hymenobacter polaris]NML67772.1 carboxypeptidase-like regulatory domain-containing protein [Hymenobacter polaris]
MPRRLLVLLLLLLPAWVGAQGISGTVRDSLTQQPLPFASVFVVNTTLGATTDEQGHYALPALPPGRYEVAAAFLGYRLRRQAVVVAAAPLTVNFALPPAAQALGEVVVRAHPALAADYQRFQELFLGASTFSRQCQVRNPAAAQVDYNPQTRQLTASTPTQPLVVDNPALGYQLTFYDLDFRASFADETVTVTTLSQVVFKELPGSAAQQRRWAANRLRAYQGSLLHFLRASYAGQLAEQGFELRRLQRLPNRRWAQADSALRALQATGKLVNQRDLPAETWRHLSEPHTISILYRPLLPLDSVRRVAADGGVQLRFRDLLAVTYAQERPDANYRLPGPGFSQIRPRYQESVLRLQPPLVAEIEPNGVLTQPLAVLTEGYWGFEKMGELLPLDYQPPSAAAQP